MPDIKPFRDRVGRCVWLDYMRILRTIHDGAQTTAELAGAHLMRPHGMREVLRRMLSAGLVHIAGQAKGANNLPMPVWAVGPGNTQFFGTNTPIAPGAQVTAVASMLRAMDVRPLTSKELAERSGLFRQRVAGFLNGCHALRSVYIAGWQSQRVDGGGTLSPLFAVGFDQPDVPRPAPLSIKVINKRANARKRVRELQHRRLVALAARSSIFRLAQLSQGQA